MTLVVGIDAHSDPWNGVLKGPTFEMVFQVPFGAEVHEALEGLPINMNRALNFQVGV